MFKCSGVVFLRKNRGELCWRSNGVAWTFFILLLFFGGLIRIAEAASCVPSPGGLIGWWAGDGNAATYFGTNNGTLQGTATATNAGLNGNCFSFDGTNGFVAISNAPVLQPTNFTIEAWVRFSGLDSAGNSTAGDQYLIFKQNSRSGDFEGFDLSKGRAGGTDFFRFIVSSAAGASAELHSATLISTGVWYHVAAVRGSNFVQLYVNGQLERQTNVLFLQDYGNFPIYFGTTGQSYWDRRFKGNLDEVALYNRPLASNEIAAIFAAGASGKCKAPDFSSQPQSQTVGVGGFAVFSAAGTGISPLAYQWRFNGTNLTGATTNNFTVNNAQPTNAGDYSVVVTNPLGSATSALATLTVLTTPTIVADPQSRTNNTGTIASFTVTANGSSPLIYQWLFNGSNFPGATASALSLTNVLTSDAGNYSVIVTNNVGSATSAVASLTVYVPPAIASQPASRTNITGTAAGFDVSASGTQPLSYQWRLNGTSLPGATDSAFNIGAVQASNAGSYTVVITNVGGGLTSSPAILTVWIPPGIAAQPQSRTNNSGTSATFSVAANGTTPFSYQWQFNGTNLPGATASNLLIANVQPSDAGNYSAVITNVAGSTSSAPASLVVYVAPGITTPPQGRTNISATVANFSVIATGTLPLSYQWRFNATNLLANAITSSLSLTNVQPADEGNYSVVITNVGGSLTSSPAALTVWVPPGISAQPQSRTNNSGTTAAFNLGATGTTPFSYQWQLNGTNLPGGTASTLTITNVQPADAGDYSVIVTNVAGSISSVPASLTVWVPPAISTPPQSQTNISGTAANFSVTATGTQPLSYQWRFNSTNLLANATTSSLSLANVQPANEGAYSVLITNVGGSLASSSAILTVWVPPTVATPPVSRTNIATTTASFSVSASGTQPFTYQWRFNGTNLSAQTNSSLTLNNVQPTDAGPYTVLITNVGGAVTSAPAFLTVWVPPSVSTPPQSRTNISGTTANFSVIATGTLPLSYQWRFNSTNLLANATASSLSLTNVQPADEGTYSVLITNVGGSLASSSAILTVWVPPTVATPPVSRTNIATTTASFSVSASGTQPFSYQWRFNGTNLSAQTNSSLTLNNVQPGDAGPYTVLITNVGGAVTSAPAFLTVWVPPSVSTPPQSRTNISGTIANFNVTATGTLPLSYQWRFNGTNPLANATASSLSLTNVQPADEGTYSVVITNVGGSLASSSATLTVWVPPTVATPPASRTNIAGTSASFSVSAFGTQPFSYQWRFNGTNLPAQTSSALTVANAQPTDAGPYTVLITNVGGAVTSSPAFLTVWVPPAIDADPQGLTNILGTSAFFSVSATGTAPLSYQWRKDGNNLSGATDDSLSFSEVQYSDTGNYTVVVTNVGGATTSAPASLLVVEPQTVLVCDPNLEAALRLELDKPTGNLNRNDFRGLKSLRAFDSHIANLCGLEWATNLTLLYLGGNLINDLSPLTNCQSLNTLFLYKNTFTDLTPISGLTNLSYLDLRANPAVTNFEAVLPQLKNITNLFLGNNSITNAAFLSGLDKLQFLGLDANSIADFSPIAGLTNLTALDVSYNGLTNLAQLSSLSPAGIFTLHLSGNAITNLSSLPAFLHLTNLFLHAIHATDLGPLGGLPNLRVVDIGGNPDLTIYSAIASLTNLVSLFVEGNAATSADFLSTLKNLDTLNFDNNHIFDISPLLSLAKLNDLSLSGNRITNLTGLSILTNVSRLRLARNSIEDLAPLSGLSRLRVLELRANNIKSLPTLPATLECLDLGQNAVTNLGPGLPDFSSLSTLSLDANGIGSLPLLQGLTGLRSLNLGSNSITDISPLLSLPNLAALRLDHNSISNASALGSFPSLQTLDLDANPLTSRGFLWNLTNLTLLHLSGTGVTNLDFLAVVDKLTDLSLAQNRLTDLSPVTNCLALHELNLGNNRLAVIDPLIGLRRLWNVDVRTNLLNLTAGSPALSVVQILTSRLVNVLTQPQNQPPLILIEDYWPIAANATAAPLSFSVADDVTPSSQLLINPVSLTPTLISAGGIVLGGTDGTRTITITPLPNKTGIGSISLEVVDDTGLSTEAILQVPIVQNQPVNIPDANLRATVRSALNIPVLPLTTIDMLLLNELSAIGVGITNLAGLDTASNLTTLSLSFNSISDLNPLHGLLNLNSLFLDFNPVVDGGPLSTLTNLSILSINNNSITNIGFVQGLYKLSLLSVTNNRIVNVSPLASLTNLHSLFLRQNFITNILAIRDLPYLASVDLSRNLLDLNPELPPAGVIQYLQSRAVAVVYLPQRPPPEMSLPATWAIPANAFSLLPFTVLDSVSPPSAIALGVASSSQALLPNTNLLLSSDNAGNWTLRATPNSNQVGSATMTFTARNEAGLTTTQAVLVFIVAPQTFPGQIVNNTNLSWTSWGFAPWFSQTNITHDGVSAAQSGLISDFQESWLATVVTGPGQLSYWWKVSSEAGFDFLELYINGVRQTNRISGEVDWQFQSVPVPAGTNTFRWRYFKDQNTSDGLDTAWLDQVDYGNNLWLQLKGPPSNGQTRIVINGSAGLAYQLQVSTNLLNWSNLAQVTLTNSSTEVTDPAATSQTRFYRLRLAP